MDILKLTEGQTAEPYVPGDLYSFENVVGDTEAPSDNDEQYVIVGDK